MGLFIPFWYKKAGQARGRLPDEKNRMHAMLAKTLHFQGSVLINPYIKLRTAAISLPPIKAVKNTCSFEAGCIQELNLASAPPRVSPGRTMNLNY